MNASSVLLFWLLPLTLLGDAPALDLTKLSPLTAAIGTPTQITITTSITDPSLISTGVNLLQLNADGSTAILETLHDDGLNGDLFSGDLVFTAVVTLNSAAPGQIQLQVSAAFKGVLQRVKSPVMTLYFQPANAPQQTLAVLAQNLASGNRAAALAYVNPSSNATRAINGFNQQALTFLASALNIAVLVGSSPDARVFQSPFTRTNGTTVNMEFDMVPGLNGQWMINSW